ncbi:hypothetical protein CFP56_027226 [Quercus suber]|uniref:Uncharacterized protein n=1 Tax=Quercus suber TaxID=58331 RepID=A0AAW0JXI9_QUESU
MSASNEEPETISLYDMVDDELEINEDQNDVDFQKYKASKYCEEGVKKIYKVVAHGKESPFSTAYYSFGV